jgi:hypothetical protein
MNRAFDEYEHGERAIGASQTRWSRLREIEQALLEVERGAEASPYTGRSDNTSARTERSRPSVLPKRPAEASAQLRRSKRRWGGFCS